MELRPDTTLIFDAGRPRNCYALSRSSKERWNLLHPLERRVEGPGPSHCKVRIRPIGTPDIVEFHLFGNGDVDAVKCHNFTRRPVHRSFGTRAVVSGDVND